KILDVDLTDDFVNLAEDLFPTNGAEAKAHIEQAQHIEIIQAFRPLAVFAKFSSGVDAANHGAHGAAGNAPDLIATGLQFLDHADMRIAARAPRAENQGYFLAHLHFPHTCPDHTLGVTVRQAAFC